MLIMEYLKAMNNKSLLVLFLEMSVMLASPLQRQYLQSLASMQTQMLLPMATVDQTSLQQQLLALQQLQALQNLKTVHAPSSLYLPQPIMILLPNSMNKLAEVKDKQKLTKNDFSNDRVTGNNNIYVDNDLDSVITEADEDSANKVEAPEQTVVLLPDGRMIIGQIISAIPWFPIEVNVPDTIRWIYNGISGIIAGIGQRLPFMTIPQAVPMTPPENTQSEVSNLKLFLQKLRNRSHNQMMPVVLMPVMEKISPVPGTFGVKGMLPGMVNSEEVLVAEHKSS